MCLWQVYRARLRSTGQEVAVKVQRPQALATISKDLYVMRRAVGVYERLVRRFTAQTTDYQRLVSTFAEGLYTEMGALPLGGRGVAGQGAGGEARGLLCTMNMAPPTLARHLVSCG